MRRLTVMFKPASSLCNMRCGYCFYCDEADKREQASFGMMTAACADACIKNMLSPLRPGDALTIAFQGGEPTLAGLDFFRHFVDEIKRQAQGIGLAFTLQTNGLLLDDAWCDFLKANDFLVGVSWDVLKDCHDSARQDAAGQGTYGRVAEAVRLLSARDVPYNVLCTLTRQLARHPQQVWRQLKRLDIRYVQFTPCLDALEEPGGNPYALTPEGFAAFYSQLFPLWAEDFVSGDYRSVKLFDDWINYLAWGVPGACGMDGRCRTQLVVEADGGVYPCDFYCLDAYRLGSLAQEDILTLAARAPATGYHTRTPLAVCQGCPHAPLCHGGCKRMQAATCAVPDGRCGVRTFLDQHMPALRRLAMQQRSFGRQGRT